MNPIRRAFRWLALWFLPCLLVVAATACSAPAPPPETTAVTQVQLEEALKDVERIKANKDRVDAYWAKLWGSGQAEIRRGELETKTLALVEQAKAESRPVTSAEINALVAAHVQHLNDDRAEIDKTLAAAKDPNLDVAAERIQLALDYVTEITEREKALARARAAFGIKPAPAFTPPTAAGKGPGP